VPVEERGLWLPAEVRAGVVGGEVEGGLVVVRGEYRGAPGERDDGWQPYAATQLDGASTSQVASRKMSGQGEGAGPELGPVGEPFVAVEVFLVDQVVRRDGMDEAVRAVFDPDGGFGQPRAAAEMGVEPKGVRQRPAGAAWWAARSSRSAAARDAML
jgi:hypothetical protein